jgi:predicted DsbA family dithiol-disulfide isomerase
VPREGEPAAPCELVEYTDPLCPWAWGAEPLFRGLRAALGDRVRRRRAYAILFDEDDDPAPDPVAETAWYAKYVEEISGHTGAPRAARLSRVAASSWPSSLVAVAAEAQGGPVADRVLRRLRETVFVLGEPADTLGAALSAARGVPGLDEEVLAADAVSRAVRDRVTADRAEARRPVPEVFSVPAWGPHPGAAKETPAGEHRYALPTLLVRGPGGHRAVPGRRPFTAYAAAVGELCPFTVPHPPVLPPATALERYRSLTEPERRLLTAGAWPPAGAVRVDTGNGPLWLHPDEAATHPATRA